MTEPSVPSWLRAEEMLAFLHLNEPTGDTWLHHHMNAYWFCSHGSKNLMDSQWFCSHGSKALWLHWILRPWLHKILLPWLQKPYEFIGTRAMAPEPYECIWILQPWLQKHMNWQRFCSHSSKTLWAHQDYAAVAAQPYEFIVFLQPWLQNHVIL